MSSDTLDTLDMLTEEVTSLEMRLAKKKDELCAFQVDLVMGLTDSAYEIAKSIHILDGDEFKSHFVHELKKLTEEIGILLDDCQKNPILFTRARYSDLKDRHDKLSSAVKALTVS